jgi:hypothetical protein
MGGEDCKKAISLVRSSVLDLVHSLRARRHDAAETYILRLATKPLCQQANGRRLDHDHFRQFSTDESFDRNV